MSLLQIAEPGQSGTKEACRKRVVGIDLGTTHSLVASVIDGQPICFANEEGHALLPSVVQYRAGQTPIVGSQADLSSIHTISSVKRFMGRAPTEIPPETKRLYPLGNQDSNVVQFLVPQRMVTPIEVSAEILRALRERAEAALQGPVEGAVITVPAYFDDAQRQATKDAGKLAGLPVLRLLNEPTAAALAYGLDHQSRGIFAVYDLGGGTFDLSILELREGVFTVLSTAGDTALGGDDMDGILLDILLKNHSSSQDVINALQKQASLHRDALTTAKSIKHRLTEEVWIQVDGFAALPGTTHISRDEFDTALQSLLHKTEKLSRQALKDAGLSVDQVDGVVLVGGATRVPAVRDHVARIFQKPPLGDVDPDKVVALGAAIQAEAIANKQSEVLLIDVTPLSLGLEMMGGVVEHIVPRNSRIPTVARQSFTTYADGQTGFDLHVVQGERDTVNGCRSLARFQLRGIPPMAAGLARLEVTFLVDENGLLQVTARETSSGKEAHIQVQPSYGLTESQIEQMLLESYEQAETDVRIRSLVEKRVETQRVMAAVRKALHADQDLLSSSEKEVLETALAHAEAALKHENVKTMDAALAELDAKSQVLAQRRMDRSIQQALAGKAIDEVG